MNFKQNLWKLSSNRMLGKIKPLRSYRQRELERDEAKATGYLEDMQDVVGKDISGRLRHAADENQTYNVRQNGKIVTSMGSPYVQHDPKFQLGPITVWDTWSTKPDSFNILVGIPDNSHSRGHWFVAQALIDMKKPGSELYAYTANYPTEDDTLRMPITELPEFQRRLAKHVREYTLFPKTGTVGQFFGVETSK